MRSPEECLEELRKRLDEVEQVNGRRRFGPELRTEVISWAKLRMAGGQSRSSIADDLGIGRSLLISWLAERGRGSRKRLKPVAVVGDASTVSVGSRAVVLPNGTRIEGLTLDEVIEVARRLR